jgi:hypothetical protein
LLDGQRTNIEDGLFIENGCPGHATVFGLPHTAGCRSQPDVPGIIDDGIDGCDAAAHAGRAYVPGLHVGEAGQYRWLFLSKTKCR